MAYSHAETTELRCPDCGRAFTALLWLILDAAHQPDLLQQVRDNTLHTIPCTHCQHSLELDIPLLLYQPENAPPLIFSPAENTSQEQDREQLTGLLGILRHQVGDQWDDTWLEHLQIVPRPLFIIALSDDPQAGMRQFMAQMQETLAELAAADPEFEQVLAEAAATQIAQNNPRLSTLQQFIAADTWTASYRFAQEHPELLDDETDFLLAGLAEAAQKADDANAHALFSEHLTLLRRCREVGLTTAFAEKMGIPPEILTTSTTPIDPERGQVLADKLVAWIQQETLEDTETYLQQHVADLLTDEGLTVMELLVQQNPHNPTVADHQNRLVQARQMGIAPMYAEIRRQRLKEKIHEALVQAGPLGQTVAQFIQAENVAAAAAILQSQAPVLLTLDAGQLLDQFVEAVRAVADATVTTHWLERQQMWQTAYQARLGRPLHPVSGPTEPHPVQPESWTERVEQQVVQAERGTQYTVITAHNSAIGDNALVINNIGQLPLRWQRPDEGRPRLARTAVGREQELAELHQRLLAEQNAAVVSRGTSAALRGQPAIGKTTLAAMYADRYGDHYPGGVLWLTVGPDRRTVDSVTPILQGMATHAYDRDLQAETLLQNSVFAADRVKSLLSGHGALLVVIDDVWAAAALQEIQNALPDDAFALLTTRDYSVAYALENNPATIQALDRLSSADARLLLQTRAPGLTDSLADKVATGLGRHAHALSLAAGALHIRKAHRYEQTATELLSRVAAGQGFGDLPRMDQAERLNELETALKYSYDYLGEGVDGSARQSWFRALGTFAQEADFDTTAAATIHNTDQQVAEEFLLLLDGLGLLQELETGGRWHQHAILRAYALSLQTTQERSQFPERQADYYLALAQTCYQSKPRDTDRVEQEFLQIQHSFTWCEQHSPRRALRFTRLLDDFMRNRGRVPLLNQWLQIALQGAELHGDRLGKANTLKSLGDLERRLGNVEQARQHYDNALPLYEAEQDPTGKMNTWISLAHLAVGLGEQAEAENYYRQTFILAEQINFLNHPVVQGWQQEYAQLSTSLASNLLDAQALADQLVAWIQTPDWSQSQAYLQQYAAILLTDEAETVLTLLQQGNPDSQAISQHMALLSRCRQVGIESAYQELRTTLDSSQPVPQDPQALALAALLQVNSLETMTQALTEHPTLLELPTLTHLVTLLAGAQEANQPDVARHLLARLVILLEQYNHTHTEQADPTAQGQFIILHESLLPLTNNLDDALAAAVRRSLSWALNTLGNQYASQGEHAQAITTYTQALSHAPENAMFYRNRAGEHLELGQTDEAEKDIEQAAQLEPDAPRLAQLRQTLEEQRSIASSG